MAQEVSCPACRHSFPRAGVGGVFPCPRCGWRVALSSTAVREGPPGEPALATVPCPHCRRWIAEVCLFCPHCERPVGTELRQPADTVDYNRSPSLLGSRPVRLTSAAVAVLGTGAAVAASLNQLLRPRPDSLRITLGVIPLAFLGVIWLVALVCAFLPAGRASPRRAVGELLFEAASAVGLVTLILFAAGVFLVTVCAVAG